MARTLPLLLLLPQQMTELWEIIEKVARRRVLLPWETFCGC
jgi:hypothetical protein